MYWSVSCTIVVLLSAASVASAQEAGRQFHPVVPRTWVDDDMASLEVPLANPVGSPKHITADYYYKIPVRPIYRQYTWYAPGQEPPGYMDSLKQSEPEIIWGEDKNGQKHAPPLRTEADWIKAGEIVFNSPLGWIPVPDDKTTRALYEKIRPPVSKGGVVSSWQLVIRQKGRIEFGGGSCAVCHTRVMPDGAIIKGAQGNYPFDREFAATLPLRGPVEFARKAERGLFATPWLAQDPNARLQQMSLEEIIAVHESVPQGVISRHRSSPFFPVHVPDLIAVKDRRYLDSTGLQQHRSIVDMMRYAALNQGADNLASYDGFIPLMAFPLGLNKLPEPDQVPGGRYSDEQLYALALFLYSLAPPANPNRFDALAARGQKVFERERCATCHTPPLYTNNKLTPAQGFSIPENHLKKYDILPISVGTDPNLTMRTRRGTGYYKVPSLKGVWYRGMFEHSGSVATLEDWFDPRRLRDDYVPTGFLGPPGIKTRPIKGHEFGLHLSATDKHALIAFLKTL